MNIYKTNYSWLLLPILLLMFQTLFLAHFGFGSNDYGYLFGMGWRILNGQDIYTDFLYARPPLSPYLTAFWLYVLPEDGQFYYARIVNYAYGFTTSFLLFAVYKRHFNKFFKTVNHGLILSLIIIFNVNYIVHFWHTVDGLFMASFAIFVGITREVPSFKRILLSSVFVVLAMSAKQSFYPMPFAMVLMFWIVYNGKAAVELALSVMLVLGAVLISAYFLANEQLLAYLDFKQYESQLAPFLEAAIIYYLNGWIRLFVFLSVAIFLFNSPYLYKYIKRKQYAKAYARFMLLFARSFIILYAILLVQFVYVKLTEEQGIIMFHTPLLGGLLAAIIWITIELQQKRLNKEEIKKFTILTMTLALAWMSSLSWGYKTPALYSGSIIFFFIYLEWHYTKKQMKNIYLYGLFFAYIGAIILLQINNLGPNTTHLGAYSKKLNGIYERNPNELKTFLYVDKKVKECPGTYTVLPSSPYIHWIHNDSPTLSLDWVSNVEMLNKRARLKEEISKVDCIIIDPYYEFWDNKRFGFSKSEVIGAENLNDFFTQNLI